MIKIARSQISSLIIRRHPITSGKLIQSARATNLLRKWFSEVTIKIIYLFFFLNRTTHGGVFSSKNRIKFDFGYRNLSIIRHMELNYDPDLICRYHIPFGN